MRSTFFPFRASPAASEILVVVLPVPPFCDAIEVIICISQSTGSRIRVFQRILINFNTSIAEIEICCQGANINIRSKATFPETHIYPTQPRNTPQIASWDARKHSTIGVYQSHWSKNSPLKSAGDCLEWRMIIKSRFVFLLNTP